MLQASLGKYGENIACQYLREKGFIIKERNYVNKKGYRFGEIDIVAWKNGMWVFVEVKTCQAVSWESSGLEERITAEKLRRLERMAESYLRDNHLVGIEYRFDALLVAYNSHQSKAFVKHIEHMFL